jgi:hypothetical protein
MKTLSLNLPPQSATHSMRFSARVREISRDTAGSPLFDALAAYQIGEAAGQSEANFTYVTQLSSIRRDQGRYSELIEPVRRNAESLVHLPVWRLVLAGLYCELDRHDEARNELNMLEGGGFEIPIEWTWASIITILAQVWCFGGHFRYRLGSGPINFLAVSRMA